MRRMDVLTMADEVETPADLTNAPQSAGDRERRLYRRYPCEGTAEVFVIGKGLRFKGRILDLSEGGCYLQTAHQLERGTHLELIFEVNRMRLRVSGGIRVVRLHSGIGIAFNHMSARRKALIQDLIEDLAAMAGNPAGKPVQPPDGQ